MGLLSVVGGIGSAAAGLNTADEIQGLGASANQQMADLATQVKGDTAFTGYGVQTGLGNSTVDAQGNTNLGVGPNAAMQGMSGSMMGNAQSGFGNAAAMAGAASGNPAYGQAMGGMNTAQGMAMNNQGNPAYQQAMGMYGQNSQNAMMGNAMGAQGAGMQGLAAQQAGMLGASNQAMQNAMGDRAGREQSVYDRAMSMQQPGLDAARASQQAREFAQGRGGVRGSQFGGTAEDAATARAQAQAQNQAAFQAMGQAEAEMQGQAAMASQFGQMGQAAAGLQGNLGMNMGQLGAQNAQLGQAAAQGMGQLGGQQASLGQSAAGIYGNMANQMGQLGSQQAQLGQAGAGLMSQIANQQGNMGLNAYQQSFLPMQQQMQMMQLGGQNADRFQSGQFTGANLGAQLGLGGIQSQVNAAKTAAELEGNIYTGAMDAAAGMTGGALGNIQTSNPTLNKFLSWL